MTSLGAAQVAYAGDKDHASKASGKQHASQTDTLKLHRADGVIGLDVVSQDGRKVGDIVDFALQPGGDAPRISHVLVMSGGFLDMGGDVRAVPVDQFSMQDGQVRIESDASTFNEAPLLGDDHAAFFADTSRVSNIDQHFGAQQRSNDRARTDDRNRNRTNGQANKDRTSYTLFSSLSNNEAIGADGTDLGHITDAWVNLDEGRLPLLEIDPSAEASSFFQTNYRQRYEVPVTRLQGKSDDGSAFQFKVSAADLRDAPSITSVDRASIDYGLTYGDSVLRLEMQDEESRS